MYQVTKRDGQVVDFSISKISDAITKAFIAIDKQYHPTIIDLIALHVTSDFEPKIRDGVITHTLAPVEHARELLKHSDMTIEQIANEIGIGDTKHFTKMFRKYTELKPSEYRKLYR